MQLQLTLRHVLRLRYSMPRNMRYDSPSQIDTFGA